MADKFDSQILFTDIYEYTYTHKEKKIILSNPAWSSFRLWWLYTGAHEAYIDSSVPILNRLFVCIDR